MKRTTLWKGLFSLILVFGLALSVLPSMNVYASEKTEGIEILSIDKAKGKKLTGGDKGCGFLGDYISRCYVIDLPISGTIYISTSVSGLDETGKMVDCLLCELRCDKKDKENKSHTEIDASAIKNGSNVNSKELEAGSYHLDVLAPTKAKASVSVYFAPNEVKSFSMDSAASMLTGESFAIRYAAAPAEYADFYAKNITWESSNTKVAKVDKNGTVTAVSAGTATITASLLGSETTCDVTVTDPASDGIDVVPSKVTLSKTTYNYTGKAKTPKVTVYDKNGNKIASKYYTVSYYDNTDAGTATVRVLTKGTVATVNGATYNYRQTVLEKTFKIKAAKATKIKLSKTSYAYKENENGFTPKVTVYDSKGKKIAAKDYTVTYSAYKRPGTATVTVKMNGNYGKKKFTKDYEITLDAKTKELLPEKQCLEKDVENFYKNFNEDQYNFDYLYYTKQDSSVLKKMLPFGDLDVSFDTLYNVPPFCNKEACFPDSRFGSSTGQKSRNSYFKWFKDDYVETKFTGTISDLIQCVVHSPIMSVKDTSKYYYREYEITCKNGREYNIRYGCPAGFQYGPYSTITIECYETNVEYDVIVKVGNQKTPWD